MRYVLSTLVLLLLAVAPAVAQQCPGVTIEGVATAYSGEEIKLKAKIEAAAGLKYRWKAAAGTIVSGADTDTITLNLTDLGGQVVEVTLETTGPDSCSASTQHKVEVALPPLPIWDPDSYGNIRFSDEKARLDNFAIQILNQPGSRGVILTYPGYRSPNEAKLKLDRAKNYLVKVRKIPANRIVTIEGGYNHEVTTSLWVIKPGDPLPEPFPKAVIPKSKLKFTKRRP